MTREALGKPGAFFICLFLDYRQKGMPKRIAIVNTDFTGRKKRFESITEACNAYGLNKYTVAGNLREKASKYKTPIYLHDGGKIEIEY